MREYLFHGKRVDNGEWVEGMPCATEQSGIYAIQTLQGGIFDIIPETVGQYTNMTEFVVTDKSFNKPLFEGDIVEVWGWRSVYGRNQSQYDKRVKVRGIIHFNSRGQWCIDYENKYNEALAKLKGSETDKRQAHGAYELYYYGYHGSDIEKYRAKQLEWHGKFHNPEDISGYHDIVKIGNVFENADLLEG